MSLSFVRDKHPDLKYEPGTGWPLSPEAAKSKLQELLASLTQQIEVAQKTPKFRPLVKGLKQERLDIETDAVDSDSIF